MIKININSLPSIQNKIYLNYDPLIYIIDDYVPHYVCDHIIENYKSRLELAKVDKGKDLKESQVKTSE